MNMNDELIDYLSRYIEVTDELVKSINSSSMIKRFEKGSTILKEGDSYQEAFFVLKGCLRSYVLKDGEDITIDFYLDEQAVMPVGYSDLKPAEFSLECLEDSLVLINTENQEKEMIEEYPELKSLCLTMSEVLAEKIQVEYSAYKTSTPEERYRDLIEKKPELLQRVPQYQIASYLGIKPESLSRIKKRIQS
jgi:CRP-like cAMP-binding protein